MPKFSINICYTLLVGLVWSNSGFASIISTTGAITQVSAPASLANGAFESSTNIRAIDEQQNVSLSGLLRMDVDGTPGITYLGTSNLGHSQFPNPSPTFSAGTVVNSHILHMDLAGNNPAWMALSWIITCGLNERIVGLIFSNQVSTSNGLPAAYLNASDPLVGFTTTTYDPGAGRRSIRGETTDQATISVTPDRRTLTVTMGVGGNNLDEIRVITQTIPEPSTYLVFTGLILCFGLAGWWRKRRQAA